MNAIRIWLTIAGLGASAHFTYAEKAFIPGDAFFHTSLTQSDVDRLASEDGPLLFSYSSSPHDGMGFGGNVGFFTLEVADAPRRVADDLKSLYYSVRRTEAKKELVWFDSKGVERKRLESNGLPTLVYPACYDWSTQRIGLKYNETWFDRTPHGVEDTTPPGQFRVSVAKTHAFYVPFIKGADAILEDWRFATRYDALPCKIPENSNWHVTGPRLTTPALKVSIKDVQIVVLTDSDYKQYYDRLDSAEFFVITEAGIKKMEFRGGKAVAVEAGTEEQ
jgi:hypothetical protein